MPATIAFAGTSLSSIGATRITFSRKPDPAPPAIPERLVESITLTVKLLDQNPLGIKNKLNQLRTLFARQSGVLSVSDTDTSSMDKTCRVTGDSIADAIRKGKTEVIITLETDTSLNPTHDESLHAVFKPDTASAIPLTNLRAISESIRPNHPAENTSARTSTTTTTSFTARVFSPDPNLSARDRMQAILDRKAQLEAINAKGGRLTIHGTTRRVTLDQLDFAPEPSARWLECSLTCHSVSYPSEENATAVYRASTSHDCASGKLRLSINGEITAANKASADTRIDAIIAAYEQDGYLLVSKSPDHQFVDGADTTNAEWLTASFTVQMERQQANFIGYTLSVTTSVKPQDGRKSITYRGEVHAATAAAARQQARTLGKNKHPFPSLEEETIDTATTCTGDPGTTRFERCTFTYEYDINDESSTISSANVRIITNRPTFGDWTLQATGTINATTLTAAENFARSLIPAGCVIREDQINENRKIQRDAAGITTQANEFVTLDFAFTTLIPHLTTAAQFTISFVPEYTTMIGTHTYAGTVWAKDEATARAALRQLGTSQTLSLYGNRLSGDPIPVSESSTVNRETIVQEGKPVCFTRLDFSLSYESDLVGEPGFDIIEAEWTLERTGQIARAAIDEIPYGNPYAQINVATTVGRLVATGQVTARNLTTARAWAHSKAAFAATVGSASGLQTEPPRESSTQSYRRYQSTNVRTFRYDFSYPYDYITGLEGFWPPTLVPV